MTGYALLGSAVGSGGCGRDRSHPLLFFDHVIAVGDGLFKANPNNLVSRLYEGDPSKPTSTFTMYYMSIQAPSCRR